MDINRYNRISNELKKGFIRTSVKAHIPTPTERDYKRGYIVRYFVQSTSNTSAPVYEVNGTGYSKFTSNPYYKTVELDWRLTGKREDVRKSNKVSIQIASETMSRLKLYLPNLVQFYDASYYTEPTLDKPTVNN